MKCTGIGIVGVIACVTACSGNVPSDGEQTSSVNQMLRGTSDYGFEFFDWVPSVDPSVPVTGTWSVNSSMPNPTNDTSVPKNTVIMLTGTKYQIIFPNLGGVVGGNVQVTSIEEQSHCSVDHWSSDGSSLNAFVDCSFLGGPFFNKIMVSYYRETSANSQLGYLLADQPTWQSYTPDTRTSGHPISPKKARILPS
jgi:hypothetical protein